MKLQKLTAKDGFYKQHAFLVTIDEQPVGLITKHKDTGNTWNPWQAKVFTGQDENGCYESKSLGSFWKPGKNHRIGDKNAAIQAVLDAQ